MTLSAVFDFAQAHYFAAGPQIRFHALADSKLRLFAVDAFSHRLANLTCE